MTFGTYPWSSVTTIFKNGQPNHDDVCTPFKEPTSTSLIGTLGQKVPNVPNVPYKQQPSITEIMILYSSSQIKYQF